MEETDNQSLIRWLESLADEEVFRVLERVSDRGNFYTVFRDNAIFVCDEILHSRVDLKVN